MIKHDPRWLDLLARYSTDLPAFVREVCGIPCNPSLTAAYQDLSRPTARVSIGGELEDLLEDGAISPMAPVALWHLLCRPMSTTVVVLPAIGNRRRKAQYRELVAKVAAGRYGWVIDYLVWRGHDLSVRDYRNWMVTLRAPIAPEALAGQCSPGLLWLLEDAHAFKPDYFLVASGSCTHYANGIGMLFDTRAHDSYAASVHAGKAMGQWCTHHYRAAWSAQTPA